LDGPKGGESRRNPVIGPHKRRQGRVQKSGMDERVYMEGISTEPLHYPLRNDHSAFAKRTGEAAGISVFLKNSQGGRGEIVLGKTE